LLSIRSDNVLVGFVDERGDRLPRPQRLDECAARRINSMPNPGSTVSILSESNLVSRVHVARRRRRADTDRLDAIVDAVKQHVETTGTESPLLERGRQFDDEL
jgi:hypothetical protein